MLPHRVRLAAVAAPPALTAFYRRLAGSTLRADQLFEGFSNVVLGPLIDNGTIRVRPVPDKGVGILAVKPIAVGSLVHEEAPLVRVSKNTQTLEVKQHPVAGPLMQRVYALASAGTFDPRDFETWPAEVCTLRL